jgi:cysteine synthase A
METNLELGLFAGKNSVWDYLNPKNLPIVPLVELPPTLNKFREYGVRIFAKQLQLLPLFNVKSIPAYSMINQALTSGNFRSGGSLVESSSMSMALSLSVLAKLQDAEKSYAVIDDNTAPDLVQTLKLFGLALKFHPFVADPANDPRPTRVQEARRFAKEIGAFHGGQYSNPANPLGHEEITGPQLMEQTGGQISVFSATLGTTGTFIGTMAYLRRHLPNIFGLGVVRAPGENVPGPRTLALLHDVGFPWQDYTDQVTDGAAIESYQASVDLIRNGIVAGPSSGLGLVGIRKFLDERLQQGSLDSIRNKNGEVVICFVCADTPFPHMTKYFSVLGDDF